MNDLLTVTEQTIAAIDHFLLTLFAQNAKVLVLVLGGLRAVPIDCVLELGLEARVHQFRI